MLKRRIAGLCIMLLAPMVLTPGVGMAAEKDPRAMCENQLLPYRQRYLCNQEMDNVQTKSEQKKVTAKFQAMIREAQKEKEKEEK